jgi:uncharacterized protein
MKEVQIEQMLYLWNGGTMCVVLKETGADRRLRICFGQSDATAIVVGLNDWKAPRPMTHDLLAAFVKELGGTTKHIVITELKEEEQTFYSKIAVKANGSMHDIDARPSDALALAVRQKVPIYAEEALLKWAETQDSSRLGPVSTIWPLQNGSSFQPQRATKKRGKKKT